MLRVLCFGPGHRSVYRAAMQYRSLCVSYPRPTAVIGGAGDTEKLDGHVPRAGFTREVEGARRLGARAAKGRRVFGEAFFAGLGGTGTSFSAGRDG